jgi:hypothetical protein
VPVLSAHARLLSLSCGPCSSARRPFANPLSLTCGSRLSDPSTPPPEPPVRRRGLCTHDARRGHARPHPGLFLATQCPLALLFPNSRTHNLSTRLAPRASREFRHRSSWSVARSMAVVESLSRPLPLRQQRGTSFGLPPTPLVRSVHNHRHSPRATEVPPLSTQGLPASPPLHKCSRVSTRGKQPSHALISPVTA